MLIILTETQKKDLKNLAAENYIVIQHMIPINIILILPQL